MRPAALAAVLLALAPTVASAQIKHFAITKPPGAPVPPVSNAVLAGDTLYIGATTDAEPATNTPPPADAKAGAKVVLDKIKKTLEDAGMTMDDLVWVQIFVSDVRYADDFNAVYRTYFKGAFPARGIIGSGTLLAGAHFEVNGIAVKAK